LFFVVGFDIFLHSHGCLLLFVMVYGTARRRAVVWDGRCLSWTSVYFMYNFQACAWFLCFLFFSMLVTLKREISRVDLTAARLLLAT